MAQYYTKNGSIPTTDKDDSPGWFAAPDKPEAPEGCEVVWWYPPGWVIRPVMPVKPGFKYKWSQSETRWIEFEDPSSLTLQEENTENIVEENTLTSGDAETISLNSIETEITLDSGTGLDTGSAAPTI